MPEQIEWPLVARVRETFAESSDVEFIAEGRWMRWFESYKEFSSVSYVAEFDDRLLSMSYGTDADLAAIRGLCYFVNHHAARWDLPNVIVRKVPIPSHLNVPYPSLLILGPTAGGGHFLGDEELHGKTVSLHAIHDCEFTGDETQCEALHMRRCIRLNDWHRTPTPAVRMRFSIAALDLDIGGGYVVTSFAQLVKLVRLLKDRDWIVVRNVQGSCGCFRRREPFGLEFEIDGVLWAGQYGEEEAIHSAWRFFCAGSGDVAFPDELLPGKD